MLSALTVGILLSAAAIGADSPTGSLLPEGRPTAERIAAWLAPTGSGGKLDIAGRKAISGRLLRDFYAQRGYEPAWFRFGIPGKQAWQMLAVARSSHMEGLEPEDYHASALDSMLRLFHRKIFLMERPGAGAALQLELLLSDAFLGMGDHLLSGRTPLAVAADPWHKRAEPFDLPRHLQSVLDSGANTHPALSGLAPQDREYGLLKWHLAAYRKILASGGWPSVPGGGNPGKHDSGFRVAALCRRLQAEGDMPKGNCPDSFSTESRAALKRFQSRHGLDTTAIVRKPDLEQLNTGVDRRIAQIEANLEYRRWMPRDPGARHIRVNLADFTLSAYDTGAESLRMKVVIGRRQDRTPVFRDRITAIELNPPWNVPDDIAREEILPELRKDSAYLGKHGMELLSGWSRNAQTINPSDIDWRSVDERDFRLRIRQQPGPANALGKLKFVLTNPFSIYLHDTPATGSFGRSERALSHGCVRLQRPVELAAWTLDDPEWWNRDALQEEIAKGRTRTIRLPENGIPIFILYWTAFVDGTGKMHFRRDIYGWDDGPEPRVSVRED